MYEPVVRTPLIIFEPGRRERLDVHTPSSTVDLLTPLAHVTGHAIPDWAEGKVLPPFSVGGRGRRAADPQPAGTQEPAGCTPSRAPPSPCAGGPTS